MDFSPLFDPGHWEFWVAIGTLLAILEVLDGSFFLLSLGVGAILTAIPVALGVESTPAIFGICAIIEVIVLMSLRPFLGRNLKVDERPSNVDALIGKVGVVTNAIEGIGSSGYVRIGSEEWRAVGRGDARLDVGDVVRIESLSGATVTVSPTPIEATEEDADDLEVEEA